MIFDLGLTYEQRSHLSTIKKTVICDIKKTHPDVLELFTLPSGRKIVGWYAWKPIAVHQALQKYPYVLWMDAGTTILGQLDDLMKHVTQNGYFLATAGDECKNGHFLHDNNWETTQHVRQKFDLDNPKNKWILSQESVMSGLCGSTKENYNLYAKDWYEATFDLKNFEDDGTTPFGHGTGRHDQTYLSMLAYTKGLHICKQDYTQKAPTILFVDNKKIPFYITWNPQFVSNKTQIYNSRGDLRGYEKYIQYK
jgi:hypothetical protein